MRKGDQVHLEVKARYKNLGQDQAPAVDGVVAAILSAFNVSAVGVETQVAYQAISEALAGTVLLADDGSGVPKAYLNYLLFDDNYVLQNQGFQWITTGYGD